LRRASSSLPPSSSAGGSMLRPPRKPSWLKTCGEETDAVRGSSPQVRLTPSDAGVGSRRARDTAPRGTRRAAEGRRSPRVAGAEGPHNQAGGTRRQGLTRSETHVAFSAPSMCQRLRRRARAAQSSHVVLT
jgi:hypothetical protein